MSRFEDAMQTGGACMMYELSDPYVYWPGGAVADAITIDAIWTGMHQGDEFDDRGISECARAEVQIWADDDNGVASPAIQKDIIVKDGAHWRVMEILETTGGLHRLNVERVDRAVVGRGRGRNRG